MPMNFDSSAAWDVHHPARSVDGFLGSGEDGHALISELKLSLVGNHDLKRRLLHDEMFLGWFLDHLRRCVDGISACDILADPHWTCIDSEVEKTDEIDESAEDHGTNGIGSESSDKFHSENGTSLKPLVDLKDTVIVLRLLLARPEDKCRSTLSKVPPPAASSCNIAGVLPLTSLGSCVEVLVALVGHMNHVILPKLHGISLLHKWALIWANLAPIVCDTLLAMLHLTESSKQAWKNAFLGVLWVFLSTLFVHFSASLMAQRLLRLVVLESYNLLPLLLEMESTVCGDTEMKHPLAFRAQNVEFLHVQVGRTGDAYLHVSDTSSGFSHGLPDMALFQSSENFRVVSAAAVATAQICNFVDSGNTLVDKSGKGMTLTSPRFRQFLALLLYTDGHYVMNVAALNLLQGQGDSGSAQDSNITQNDSMYPIFERIFPRIVELLHCDATTTNRRLPCFLRPPILVVSELCLKYPAFCRQLKSSNVDRKIMDDFSKLFDASPVFKYMQAAKKAFNKTQKVADFTPLKKNQFGDLLAAENSHVSLIASHVLLLSVFTSSNEDFRRRITLYLTENESKTEPNFLCYAIFEVIENYDFLCAQLLLNYKVFWKVQETAVLEASTRLLGWLSENVSVLLALIEHPIHTHTFYLMRSLSRSVSTLRTFFVDCNLIRSSFSENAPPKDVIDSVDVGSRDLSISSNGYRLKGVLQDISARYDREASADKHGNLISCLLKTTSRMVKLDQAMAFFASTKSTHPEMHRKTPKALCKKKVVILATLANFILDFSSFRCEIVNHERFLRDLVRLFERTIHNMRLCDHKDLGEKEVTEVLYELFKVQLGILQVIKNYLYNENEENRKIVWDVFPLSLIFELSLYGVSSTTEPALENHLLRLQQKVIAFEIMRNLTAASSHFSESIKNLYVEYARSDVHSGDHPQSWNEYLLESMLAFDLFVDVDVDREYAGVFFLKDDEFVFRVLQKPEYVKLVVAINYLEDHRYTNMSTFRRSDFPHEMLLKVWKRLLSIQILAPIETGLCGLDVAEVVKLANQLNDIKISICWVLINLTWKDDSFGYGTVSEATSFRLMDIVLSQTASVREPRLNLDDQIRETGHSRDVPENFENGEDPENDEENGERSDEPMSPKTRARLLYKEGFSQALEKLTYELSVPRPKSNEESHIALARFDSLNSNDLYEKCKTAHYQIVSLLARPQDIPAPLLHGRRHNRTGTTALRRLSNIHGARESNREGTRESNSEGSREGIRESIRESAREQSRGGNEGFGQWSDDEDEQRETREDGNGDGGSEEPEPSVAEDEVFDEYWIR